MTVYHNWTLVQHPLTVAWTGMNKAIERQMANNFYDLWLNDETARYIYRILAIKEVYNHPVTVWILPQGKRFLSTRPDYSVSIDSAISQPCAFAKKQEVNYRILREFNPWIQRYNLPNKTGKTYIFLLPKQGMMKV